MENLCVECINKDNIDLIISPELLDVLDKNKTQCQSCLKNKMFWFKPNPDLSIPSIPMPYGVDIKKT